MGAHGREETGYKLLIVDDQASVRDLLEHRFESEGFLVETVSDGREALDRLRGADPRFDAVMLDVSMPNMDGFETLRRIQEFERPPLAVMVSGRSSESEQIRAFELGAVDYVTKPFKLRVLVARLESHLDRDRRRRWEPEPEAATDSEPPPKAATNPGAAESDEADGDEWPGSWASGAEGGR